MLLVSDPKAENSAAALSVGVGWLQDPSDYPGMAHFLEHMLFMGTERYPEPDGFMSFIAQHGAPAYTWTDITNYMFEIPDAQFTEALDRFAEFFKRPLLDPQYITKEKMAQDIPVEDLGMLQLYLATEPGEGNIASARVAEIDDAAFERLRSGVLSELTLPPKNLADEAAPFLRDWERERYHFDSRERLIAALEALTIADLQCFYRDTVERKEHSAILIQLRGSRFAEEPFALPENATTVESVTAFHRGMPVQEQ